ncbi:hypothetical protein WJX77_000257 [Trebouxia sp. C0004]
MKRLQWPQSYFVDQQICLLDGIILADSSQCHETLRHWALAQATILVVSASSLQPPQQRLREDQDEEQEQGALFETPTAHWAWFPSSPSIKTNSL